MFHYNELCYQYNNIKLHVYVYVAIIIAMFKLWIADKLTMRCCYFIL